MDDGYHLFSHFWWLIFPVFGMAMGVMSLSQRHSRANRTIDIIKSYADQGKEPPTELLALLRDPEFGARTRGPSSIVPVFLFGSLAVGFVLFALLTTGGDIEAMAPFLFVALVMAGLCLGMLAAYLARKKRDGNSAR